MNLFNLISALNPTKVKTETRARAVHEVPLVTATTSRVIDMDDMDVALGSSGTPPALEKSPLDFADEDPPQIITERGMAKDQVQDGLSHEPPYRKCNDHEEYPRRKSLAPLGLDAGSTFATPVTQDTPAAAKSVSDPGPLSYAKPQPHPEIDIAQESRVREINLLPLHGWVARRYLSSEVGCDKQLPPGHPGRVPRHDGSHSTARVAMGSQLRLRFEQEVRLLRKTTAKIAKRDQSFQAKDEDIKKLDQEIKSLRAVEAKIHSLRNQTKNLKTLLEAEVDMKKAAEAKNAELAKELESHRVYIRGLSLGHWAWLAPGRYELCRVLELRHAFVDVVSAGLVKGMSKGLKHGIEHRKANRDLEVVKAYDPKADRKYILIYPEVCDPEDPWACKEDMMLEDAIAANKSRARKRRSAGWFVVPVGLVSLITPGPTASVSVATITPRGWRFFWQMPLHRPRWLTKKMNHIQDYNDPSLCRLFIIWNRNSATYCTLTIS
nr:hypothetical protein [Tanacetum cinerariifolium]